jgi:ABC-type nitrate/sulfonate/bicarbonate transport system substrate-binding protein
LDCRRRTFGEKAWTRFESDLCRQDTASTAPRQQRGPVRHGHRIKTAEELRGKTVATGRPGAFGDTMVRYVLRAKLGLVPDRDVKMLPIGEAQLAFPALERGIVQAASLTIPFTLIAKRMGLGS